MKHALIAATLAERRQLDARVRGGSIAAVGITGSAYNNGIDNITLASAALIPEPETDAMFVAGLALLAFVIKRRSLAL